MCDGKMGMRSLWIYGGMLCVMLPACRSAKSVSSAEYRVEEKVDKVAVMSREDSAWYSGEMVVTVENPELTWVMLTGEGESRAVTVRGASMEMSVKRELRSREMCRDSVAAATQTVSSGSSQSESEKRPWPARGWVWAVAALVAAVIVLSWTGNGLRR